jgi:protein-tyrosine phosphatase
MAEGLFRKMLGGRVKEFLVSSAGISALDGFPATEETIRVMREEGVDVSRHRSRRLSLEMIRDADKIFVMEMMHKDMILRLDPGAGDKVFLLTEFMEGAAPYGQPDIPDPIRMPNSFYQSVLKTIRDCLVKITEDLCG